MWPDFFRAGARSLYGVWDHFCGINYLSGFWLLPGYGARLESDVNIK